MAGDASLKSVVAAVVGNGTVAVLKLVVFSISGSGAMLAEGIHSIADTMNQALLWFGIARSRRAPDAKHPYGYGAERYFWSLVSAMGIFVLGCGVTVTHGVLQLMKPHEVHAEWTTWAVLGLSAVIEGYVLTIAVREVFRRKADKTFLQFLRSSSDPTLLAVVFEDAIAVAGVFLAALGIGLSIVTGYSVFDGIASVMIGLSLGALALILALKNKELLIGRAAGADVERTIRRIVVANEAVAKVLSLRTRVVAAGQHRVDLQVDFDAEAMVDRLLPRLKADIDPAEDPDGFARTLGARLLEELADEVDRIEASIRAEVPSASLIDIEGD